MLQSLDIGAARRHVVLVPTADYRTAKKGRGDFNGSILVVSNLCLRRWTTFRIVDSCRTVRPVTMPNGAYWVQPNQSEAGMPLKAQSLVLILSKSQPACLIALRNGKVSEPEIAIQARSLI